MVNFMKKIFRPVRNLLIKPILPDYSVNYFNSKTQQIALFMEYRRLAHLGEPLPSYRDVGFRVYSEGDEDGILLLIFAVLGIKYQKLIEISCGHAKQSIGANLIVNHGWSAMLFEFDSRNVKLAKEFFDSHYDTRNFPPVIIQDWVTVENINELIRKGGMVNEIDLLVIDVNGVDYWL